MFAYREAFSSRGLPIVRARISMHPEAVAAVGPCPPHPVPMLIDTGSTISGIPRQVVISLSLASIGRQKVSTALDAEDSDIYRVAISISVADESGRRASVDHIVSMFERTPRGDDAYEGILGFDFLQHFQLTYDGPGRSFALIVPG